MLDDTKFPEWLAAEGSVRRLFELLGFDVINISIQGRQIDLVATRQGSFDFEMPETWIIEVTTEKVGVDKGSKDGQKLLLAKQKYPNAKLLLVSTAGFTDDQAATLKTLGIYALTYSQLEEKHLNLRRYANHALAQLSNREHVDKGYTSATFVQPQLEVSKTAEASESTDGDNWISEVLHPTGPTICALVGGLGSGKTSLLERLVETGAQKFLQNSSTCPVPFYIPLGRYKQHSGDIEQMIMSELKRAGEETFPTSLVRHLIDRRRIILLLDGLDEVHPIQNSDDILETISGLIGSIGKEAVAVISCRRQFFESTQEELAYFGPYTAGRLANIQGGLTRILRGQPSTYLASLKPFDRTRIDEYLKRRCGMTDQQIADFFAGFYGFEQMAETPVLLAMMATAIAEKLIVPTAKEAFPLLSLYEVYINRWIERDQGRARLTAKQRRNFSLTLAEQMFWNLRDSETWTQVRAYLREDPEWSQGPLTDEESERDIRNSGFLIRDMDDKFRFVHRSIMEFLAAEVELGRLEQGSRPRHFPTDGFRLFLGFLMARKWLSAPPFPPKAWERNRGDDVIDAQASMLASATAHLPAGQTVSFSNVEIRTSSSQNWRSTQFSRVRWRVRSGRVQLGNCSFVDSEIHFESVDPFSFSHCSFERTKIHFSAVPETSSPSLSLSAQETRLHIAPGVWELATLIEAGAEVTVGAKQWILKRSSLTLFASAYDRLHENNRTVQTFTREPNAERFAVLEKKLRGVGWMEEWKRGTERGIKWLGSGNADLKKLRMEPMEIQHVFEEVFGAV